MNHAGKREMLKWKDILHFSIFLLPSLGRHGKIESIINESQFFASIIYDIYMLHCRRRAGAALPRHPQLPLQARAAAGSPLHLPRQARLGAVLLQDRPQGGAHRPRPQEPASLHRDEPH